MYEGESTQALLFFCAKNTRRIMRKSGRSESRVRVPSPEIGVT